MFLDFDKIDGEVFPQFKGGVGDTKLKMNFDGLNKIMRGTLGVGASIGLHTHETNSEIIYIISGEAKCIYDDTTEFLIAGQCHYCPKGHAHSLINNSETDDLEFFAVVPEQ